MILSCTSFGLTQLLLGNEMKSDCQCDVMVLITCTERANIINNQTKSNVIQLLFSWHSTLFYY